jgi:hypothetical protein
LKISEVSMALPLPETRRARAVALAAAAVLVPLSALAPFTAASSVPADEEGSGVDPVLERVQQLVSDPIGAVRTITSSVVGSDGEQYSVINHLDRSLLGAGAGARQTEGGTPKEWLVVWAGDENVADTNSGDLGFPLKGVLPGFPNLNLPNLANDVADLAPGPDFLAVIDATRGSSTYGEVVNTATVGPLVENEPHHMQYVWHKGDNIFAGGLFTDVTYVLDPSKLPKLELKGINLPTDTLCGSVPDAYWVTKDHKAYGTYMGGPDLPGPCVYTDGQVRVGNGFAGSPGELVRLDENGRTISEAPASTLKPETEYQCDQIPALSAPTCANPHGVQAREDLDRLITSDYTEPRNIILNPVAAPSSYIRRPTVRIWDISDRDHPELESVSFLPDGPRTGDVPHHEENRAAMETTVTNQPEHKGAFAQTMQGGAIYYTPDITVNKPEWREVFDLTLSNKQAGAPTIDGASSNGGWLQTSPDDRYLYHAVIGRGPGGLGQDDLGAPGYILVLDIRKLLASGDSPKCSIDTLEEVTSGGQESDCPAIADILPASGGPHWGALDNFELGSDGYYHETEQPTRLAYSNYFVARTGLDGDHRVCLVNIEDGGDLSLDEKFVDENSGAPCVDFDRMSWPHGDWGSAKPHSMLFVTADDDVR